jgi:hypothetical protein
VVFKKRVPKNKEVNDTETVNKEEDLMNTDSINKNESKKKSSKTKNKNNQMTLSHLGDDEEDE